MEPVEVIEVHEKEVACDGGKGSLGHPKVYLHMNDEQQVECPYCGKLFKYRNNS